MKLIRKHALRSGEPDSRIRNDIRNYLHYQPTADEDDPVTCGFLEEGIVAWSGEYRYEMFYPKYLIRPCREYGLYNGIDS